MEIIDLTKYLLVVAIFTPLQKLLPRNKHQKIFRRLWRLDIAHLVFSGILIRAGGISFLFAGVILGDALMPKALREFITGQHIIIQAGVILVMADLGFYFIHRMFHSVPFLWRIHAIHHSIEEMDWLAAHRVHPIDQILTRVMTLTPVFFIGFSSEAVIVFFFIYEWQSLLVHSNVNIPFGPFRWLAASPEFHHWHHANDPEALDKNFAGQLPLIDKLFGTAYMPAHRSPKKYGTDTPVPDDYIDQLLMPFSQGARNKHRQSITQDDGDIAPAGLFQASKDG